MSKTFEEEQNEDDCLRFIRDISSQNQSDLFKNQSVVKIQEEQSQMNEGFIESYSGSGKSKSGEHNKLNRNRRGFYRDKMAVLISQKQMQQKPQFQYVDHSQCVRNKDPLSKEQQLRRNRQSAKHSRKRRKQYIETLQQKNEQNQRKIQQLTTKLRQVQAERDRLKNDNRSYNKTFLAAKNQAYENLNDILHKNGKVSSDKLSQELQMLIARYGAAGSERIATTDYYMKQIIEILLSDIHKYIVQCVVNDSGLFGLGQWTKFDDQVCNILKVNKEVRVKLNRNYKKPMLEQVQTFKTIAQKFYDSYRALQDQAKIIEKIFQKITVEFNDACIAQLLLWFEQNKFSKQLKRIRACWARSVEEPEQQSGRSRKIRFQQLYRI